MLLIDCAGEFDRRLMRGMFRYSKENGGWLFYRIPPAMNDSRPEGASLIADWARKWKADAIVGRWNFSDTSEETQDTHRPSEHKKSQREVLKPHR